MDIHVLLHSDEGTTERLCRIERMLGIILKRQEIIMDTDEDLQTSVTRTTTVEQSAIKLINGIAQQLKSALAQNNTAAIQTVIDQLDSNTNDLAAAVAANTQQTANSSNASSSTGSMSSTDPNLSSSTGGVNTGSGSSGPNSSSPPSSGPSQPNSSQQSVGGTAPGGESPVIAGTTSGL